MEKSWVNFVKCLLDRLYKLCLPYLFIYFFFWIYFNVDFFFQNFEWSCVFNIFKLKPFFIKCNFSSYNMFYSYNIYKEKYVFPEQLTLFCGSNYFYYQIDYFYLKMDILNFLSNNFNGLKISNNGIIFLQEAHCFLLLQAHYF